MCKCKALHTAIAVLRQQRVLCSTSVYVAPVRVVVAGFDHGEEEGDEVDDDDD